jgi:hypothetical protein
MGIPLSRLNRMAQDGHGGDRRPQAIVRQNHATLTHESPGMGAGWVEVVIKVALRGERQGECGADLTLLVVPRATRILAPEVILRTDQTIS